MRTLQDLPELDRKALAELRRRIQQEFPDWSLRMVLFGSRARGDADPDSDMDILLDIESKHISFTDKQRLRRVAGEVSIDFNVVISLLTVDRRLRAERGDFSIFQNIREEGILITPCSAPPERFS